MDGGMNANHAGPSGGAAASPPGGNHTQGPPGANAVDQRKFDVEYQTQTLNAYIYDYLRKQNLNQTATCLLNEGSFPANPVVIENRDGGLLEWWLSLFWDAYLQRLLQKPDAVQPGVVPAASVVGGQQGAPVGGPAPPAAAAVPVPAPPVAEPKSRGRPVGVEVKAKPESNPPVLGPTGVAPAPYVPPAYKTVGRAAPSPQSLYLAPGWGAYAGGPAPDYARGVNTGFAPPSSPDVSAAAVPSPVASMTPRSPQTGDGADEESKKRGKGRRRSTASVLPPDGAGSLGAQPQAPGMGPGQPPRGDQNAVPLPYASVPYRPPDNGMLGSTKPLFYPTAVGYPPPARAPQPLPKGASPAPSAPPAATGPALYFTGVTYPPPPRNYTAPVPPPPVPQPSAASMYAGATRSGYGTDTGRAMPGQWKSEDGSAAASVGKRKASEEQPSAAPIAPLSAASAATMAASGRSNAPAAAAAPPAAVSSSSGGASSQRSMWYGYGMPPTMDGRAQQHNAGAPTMAYSVPAPTHAYTPYATPHWSLDAAGPVEEPNVGYGAPPLGASTSAEFYSTLFPEDEQAGQGQGGAGGVSHNGNGVVGGDADGNLAGSAGAQVDPDAFLAAGNDEPQSTSLNPALRSFLFTLKDY